MSVRESLWAFKSSSYVQSLRAINQKCEKRDSIEWRNDNIAHARIHLIYGSLKNEKKTESQFGGLNDFLSRHIIHFTDQQQQHIRSNIHLKQIIFPIYSLCRKTENSLWRAMLCENSLNTRPKPKSTISGASRAIHHKYWIFRFSILPNVFLQFSTERLAVVCFGSFISCSTRYWVSQFVYSIARTAEVLTDLTGRRARRRWFLTFSFSSSCRHSC